jgi:hypothetical protein
MSYRFLLVALCLCSMAAFAQDHSLLSGDADRNAQQVPDFRTPPASTQSEPWRILPKSDSDKDKNLILMTPELGPKGIALTPGGPLAPETMCYSIRSYVVARDHKHSDSVHPVGYTTCVPASRYRLKTADVQIVR